MCGGGELLVIFVAFQLLFILMLIAAIASSYVINRMQL
jgi:hypothetical protein